MASNRAHLRSAFRRSRSATLRSASDGLAECDPVSFSMMVGCGAGAAFMPNFRLKTGDITYEVDQGSGLVLNTDDRVYHGVAELPGNPK